jgi:molybdenum cofactor biosynthesis enzyme MoaA
VTGGEPLCRSDLEEILRAAPELGYNLILLTNGVLLDRREKVLDHIASLVNSRSTTSPTTRIRATS